MDKRLEEYLLDSITTSFNSFTATFRILLQPVERKGFASILNTVAKKLAEEDDSTLEASTQKEEKKEETTPSKNKKANASKDAKESEIKEEEPKAEVQEAKVEEQVLEEKPKSKTTLVELRKLLVDLSREGYSKLIQDVMTKDFGVTRLSEIKEEDYDDLATRVLYHAGKLEEKDV